MMIPTLKILLTAAMLSCAAVVAGCAHDQHARSTGEVIDDSAITTKVKSALLAEKDVNSLDIEVKTFEGTVQLSGFVDSQWQIDKATEIASGVAGVQHVTNNLIHKPRS
ncbi:MAG TPA: BON domain-containing protein [Verrucomicrobiae bacterium]|nr:BON domain-containing protein [Verrucomicrobiae bacterium]